MKRSAPSQVPVLVCRSSESGAAVCQRLHAGNQDIRRVVSRVFFTCLVPNKRPLMWVEPGPLVRCSPEYGVKLEALCGGEEAMLLLVLVLGSTSKTEPTRSSSCG